MQYQAEQADPEPTEEVHEDLDNEDGLEPHHHKYNTRAETVYTMVRDLWSHNFSFKRSKKISNSNDQKVNKLQTIL